jgi:16S rRNA (guanine527-N7)-methyltransferase
VAALTPAEFAQLVPVSRETLARLEAFAALLVDWNQRLNLVGHSTLEDLWRRHILDSAQLRALIPSTTRSLVDLGTGAGFPGVVLAIMGGPAAIHLVESDQRKCVFLREALRLTGAAAKVHAARVEAVPEFPADIVTARALAPLPRLLDFAERFLGPDTVCLFLKGRSAAEELTLARKDWTMSADLLPSRSDPTGAILRLSQIRRERRAD